MDRGDGNVRGRRAVRSGALLETVNAVFSTVVVAVMFAMIFKFLPDVTLAWRNVWLGAAVTALLFTAGKSLIGLYLGRTAVASAYGAAGRSSSS